MSDFFYILGSSSGLPVADKATSGYLLKTDESLTLIDCGGGVTQSFLKRGFDPLHVDNIIISHTHSDHVCELTLFLQMIYLHKREKPLDLYLPEEFITPFKNLLRAVYLLEEKMTFKLNLYPITSNFSIEKKRFKITAILNDHLQSYKELIDTLNLPNKMQSFSFLIETSSKTILYSSDLASMNPIQPYIQDLDYLLIETTHISIDELVDTSNEQNISQIIATHLGTKDEIKNYMSTAKDSGLRNLIIAIDGMEIQL